MSWGPSSALRARDTYTGKLERPTPACASRQTAHSRSTASFARFAQTPPQRCTTTAASAARIPAIANSGAVLQDARPDPVGGIRTGTWEGALYAGPWGDRRQGAFRFFRNQAHEVRRGSPAPPKGRG